jgi:hypothetical protein
MKVGEKTPKEYISTIFAFLLNIKDLKLHEGD